MRRREGEEDDKDKRVANMKRTMMEENIKRSTRRKGEGE
jgi:hypothetical protein